MNTTARIESTGETNRIHVSSETAELLREAGKGTWVTQREEKVVAKGEKFNNGVIGCSRVI